MHTKNNRNLIAIFAIASLYSGTLALAATDANPAPQKLTPQEKAVNKDFSKVSADGSGAFMDLTLTRLALFEGRVDAAKKFIDKAEKALSKARSDESRFLKAEADLNASRNTPPAKNPATTADQQNSSNDNQQNASNDSQPNVSGASQQRASNTNQANPSNNSMADQQNASANGLVDWLPVDVSITIDENFSQSPEKKAAVADANKSLANGNRKDAVDRLKLNGVNITVVVLALPLNDTISKVQQAANLIDDGKYYEASQAIKQVQDSVRSDVLDFEGRPANRAPNRGASRTDD